jgi:hypothetical protein
LAPLQDGPRPLQTRRLFTLAGTIRRGGAANNKMNINVH